MQQSCLYTQPSWSRSYEYSSINNVEEMETNLSNGTITNDVGVKIEDFNNSNESNLEDKSDNGSLLYKKDYVNQETFW